MEDHNSLSHTRWQCKYYVIFIPKYRRKKLYEVVKKRLGIVFDQPAEQKGCWKEKGNIMPDHVHMLINVPPKLAVSAVVGYIKGKSAIHVARHFLKRERNYAGQSFWARGFFVDTVGRDTEEKLNLPVVEERKNCRNSRKSVISRVGNGGRGGIRTRGEVPPTFDFEAMGNTLSENNSYHIFT